MNAVWPHLPALQVVVPLLAAVLVAFLRRGAPAYALATLVVWTLPFIAGALLWQTTAGGPISYWLGGWEPPWGIEYRVDTLNAAVLLLVSSIAAVVMPYAARSVTSEIEDDKAAWFYCMFLLCLTGLLGMAVTGDAFNVFVFLEISSLSTYVLIALGPDRRALLASFQYLVMGTIGATFYIIGIAFLYILTGTLNIADMAERLAPIAQEQSRAISAALAFIAVGLSLKIALFPLHVWLPNAYAYAPSWVTVFLSATATKVAIYVLIRFLFGVFGVAVDLEALPVTELIVALSLAAMFVASLVAVFENNLKRMLAYSSVGQIGYITLGVGLANQLGLTGGLAHLYNHAVMKAALFLAAGAIVFRIGTCTLDRLAGLGRKMPLTMVCFTIAGFGLIGTPGTAGFISKWYLAAGALERGWWPIVLLIMASSMIAFVYVWRVLEVVWLREPSPEVAAAKDPPASMAVPMVLLTLATVYFGFETRLTAGVGGAAAQALLRGLK